MHVKNITWNPNDIGALTTLTNNNLTVTTTASNSSVRATEGVTEGKWYWENKVDALNGAMIGIMSERLSTNVNNISSIDNMFYYSSGNKYNGGTSSSYGEAYYVGNIIGVGLDMDKGTISFYKNGVPQGIAFTTAKNLGRVFPFICGGNGNPTTVTVNFGNQPFSYPLPIGYKPYVDQYKNEFLFKYNKGNCSLKPTEIFHTTEMYGSSSPSPLVARASSEQTYSAWKAFDGSNYNTNHWRASTNIRTGWIYIKFGKKTKANTLFLSAPDDKNAISAPPRDFIIQGSNDGLVFVDLKKIEGQTWFYGETKEFTFGNVEYQYYRLSISATYHPSNGSTSYGTLGIGEILYAYIEKGVISSLPKASADDFINYGADTEVKNLNTVISHRKYILQDEISEKEGNSFIYKLDKKPLRISFD